MLFEYVNLCNTFHCMYKKIVGEIIYIMHKIQLDIISIDSFTVLFFRMLYGNLLQCFTFSNSVRNISYNLPHILRNLHEIFHKLFLNILLC